MIRRLAVLVLVAGLVGGGASVIQKRRRALAELPPPAAPPVPVRVGTVRSGALSESLRTVALVQPDTHTTIAAQVPGVVLEVKVREGDRVTKGQPLVRIDARTLDDAVAAAQARLAAAKDDLQRLEAVHQRDEALLAGRAMSQQAFEAGQAQLEGARATAIATQRALDSASTARGYAEVRAPVAGVVTARLVEPGDLAGPGKALLTVQAQGGSVRLLSKLSQSALATVKEGGRVTVEVGDAVSQATVTRVFPALDAARLGSVETVLSAAPAGLPAGSIVAVTYEGQPTSGLVVPGLSLLEGLGRTLVVRVKDARAEAVSVRVVARGAAEAVVTGLLAEGDELVLALPSELMALTTGTPLLAVRQQPGAAR